ncbi:MAG: fumarylacetoacetate hydrolase family protein, partial [Nitrospinota bacterium]
MARYALTTYQREGGFRVGIVVDGRVMDCLESWNELLGEVPFSQAYPIRELLSALDEVHPRLEALAEKLAGGGGPGVEEATLRAPILYPPTIFCAAANYRAHAEEMGGEVVDKGTAKPYFFLKIPHQCVIGPGDTVRLPRGLDRVDWEGELAVVIGKGGTDVPVERALDHVAGYTILNDVSARDRNFRSDWKFKYDWFGGKCSPTFAPLGPYIVPKAYVDDPNDLRLRLWVNDDLMQDANTRDMIF